MICMDMGCYCYAIDKIGMAEMAEMTGMMKVDTNTFLVR